MAGIICRLLRRNSALVIGSLLLTPHIGGALDLLVYNNNNSGAGSLRQAIIDNNALGGGNTIVFSNTVKGSITLTTGELVISGNVTIVGPGPHLLAVSGSDTSRVFRITNAVASISGLSIVNGRVSTGSGGGILNQGSLLLTECTVSNCFAQTTGGGIDSLKPAGIVRCSIINNHADYGAGLDGFVNLTNCTVTGNSGFVAVGGGNVIWSSTIADNSAGGMVGGGSPPPLIANSIFAYNTGADASSSFTSAGYNLVGNGDAATGFLGVGDQVGSTNSPLDPGLDVLGFHGGVTPTMPPISGSLAIDQGKSFGLMTDQRGRPRTYDDSTVFNATLGDGTDIGAVEVVPVSMPLLVTSTNDSGPGSLREAIFKASSFENDYITFATNVTNTIRLTSGELVIDKSLSIEGPGIQWFGGTAPWKLTISGNDTTRVFDLKDGNTYIAGLTIANGLTNQGGGIFAGAGNHFIEACQIVSNSATISGGGVHVNTNAILTLYNSSVTDNQAVFTGGGIAQGGPSSLVIGHCTIAGNRTTWLPDGLLFTHGGGVSLGYGVFYLINSTVASNVSTYAGGGLDNSSFSPASSTVRNSIIAGNTAPTLGPDAAGQFSTDGYNLVGNTNGVTGFGTTGDQLNVNPLLGPLADYGGPTPSMALRSGSPAIDKGYNFGWQQDQRYLPRRIDDANIPNASGGDGTDIGAFEVDPNFRIVELRRGGSDVMLNLMTVLGRNYRVEYTNHFSSGTWTTFTNSVPGNGYLLWVTNFDGANQPQRFYRGAVIP